jgi:hypothetical protein
MKMTKIEIDLGRKMSEPCCAAPVRDEKERVYYPEAYINSKKPLPLPKEGTITFRYKKVGSSERNDDYSCTLELHKIEAVGGDSSESKEQTPEQALDALAAALKKEKGY